MSDDTFPGSIDEGETDVEHTLPPYRCSADERFRDLEDAFMATQYANKAEGDIADERHNDHERRLLALEIKTREWSELQGVEQYAAEMMVREHEALTARVVALEGLVDALYLAVVPPDCLPPKEDKPEDFAEEAWRDLNASFAELTTSYLARGDEIVALRAEVKELRAFRANVLADDVRRMYRGPEVDAAKELLTTAYNELRELYYGLRAENEALKAKWANAPWPQLNRILRDIGAAVPGPGITSTEDYYIALKWYWDNKPKAATT